MYWTWSLSGSRKPLEHVVNKVRFFSTLIWERFAWKIGFMIHFQTYRTESSCVLSNVDAFNWWGDQTILVWLVMVHLVCEMCEKKKTSTSTDSEQSLNCLGGETIWRCEPLPQSVQFIASLRDGKFVALEKICWFSWCFIWTRLYESYEPFTRALFSPHYPQPIPLRTMYYIINKRKTRGELFMSFHKNEWCLLTLDS